MTMKTSFLSTDREKGFIQVPILIAIILGAAIIGGSYFAYQSIKLSQNSQTQVKEDTSKGSDAAAPESQQVEIDYLKKELESLKQSPKTSASEQKSISVPPPSKSEIKIEAKLPETPPPPVPVSVVSVQDNTFCSDTRKNFEEFEQKYNDVSLSSARFSEVMNIYNQANSAPKSLTGISAFQYLYSQSQSQKDLFVQSATDWKELIAKLPSLTKDQSNSVSSLKSSYSSGITLLTSSYNLNFAAFKTIVEIGSLSALDSAGASLDSAHTSYTNAFAAFNSGAKNFNTLKDLYDKTLKNGGCGGLCKGGYAVSNGQCVPTYPKVNGISPSSGPAETVFSINGTDFGDTKDTVVVGNQNAEIVSWSNTQVKFKANVVLAGGYVVKIKNTDAGQITIIK